VRAGDRSQTLTFVLLILTGLAGIVDAESFLSFGHVFTANMTGNVVFIAFAAAGAPGLSVARSGTALVGFLGGATLGARMALHLDRHKASRVLAAALFAQAALLFAATALAIGREGWPADRQAHLYAAIALTSLAMGIQNVTALKLGVPGLTPNVLTGALTGIAGDASLGPRNPVWTRRVASVVMMFAGALLGVWLWRLSAVWPLMAAAAVSAGCGLITRAGPLPSCPCLRGSTGGSGTPTCRG
jgi:uncharacterized membrane protein YoaK (UPF0700 family)